ncbi:MAG: hypothetical protein HQM09_14030 [Candidatus Riflebacteria bacterium]|nr:hypothetical protein [Candidatus Riflebacteria bacterium]
MKVIGFDIGSATTKSVVLDPSGKVEYSFYKKRGSDDAEAISKFLSDVDHRYPGERFKAGITGGNCDNALFASITEVNGISAVASAIQNIGLPVYTIIELGGHTAKLILLDPSEPGIIRDFAVNDVCAAGSGSFLEKQADRLQISVEKLSDLSVGASKQAEIAGRCAVFAKSDMIHLQQKGTPIDEIAFGLCMAICRNSLATLFKGREIEFPIVIAGGCARNGGILRAFRKILDVKDIDVITSSFPGLEGAIGAALRVRDTDSGSYSTKELSTILVRIVGEKKSSSDYLPPLPGISEKARSIEPEGLILHPVQGYLGIDIGSVSTDFVVMSEDGEIVSSLYMATKGTPVSVLQEGLGILKDRFPGGLRILGCGTTGSGRYLAGKLLGADIIKNEITCQLLGARHYKSDVDMIFEIGGQDSKFVSVNNGHLSDFVMNKICSAGTGSFLEEQAGKIGVNIVGEFASRAFNAKKPRDLGSRCTVFMESEVVNAEQNGQSVDDTCASMAYSIVRNYLDKVVGNRTLGKTIVFQGGTASNDAVVAAFEEILNRSVSVHPYNRLSGAIGVAHATRSHMATADVSLFKGFDAGPKPILHTFRCDKCSNNCEVNLLKRPGEQIYFGDTCERYSSQGNTARRENRLPNLAMEYNAACEAFFPATGINGPRIGIPRASTFMSLLPFWGTFFREIGCLPVLSDPSGTETLALGLKHLPAPVCLPVKLTAGHVNALLAKGVDYVFIPSMMRLPGDAPEQSHACPYSMSVPFMITGTRADKLLSPVLSLMDEENFVAGFSSCIEILKTSESRIRESYRSSVRAQKNFDELLRIRGRQLIAAGGYRYLFVVIGKPYNTFDGYLNLSLFERLRRQSVLALPEKYLTINGTEMITSLPWRFSADMYRAVTYVADVEGMFPVIISNFGCGPDAFTFKHIEDRLGKKPHLMLEFDEHRGEAGLITRIEAFIDQLEDSTNAGNKVQAHISTSRNLSDLATIPDHGSEVRIPYFGDTVFAFSGLWKRKGFRIEILPVPDRKIFALGERYALGKECYPFSMMVGDLLNLHHNSVGRRLTYYIPGLAFPCLLNQYGRGIQMVMNELKIESIRMSSPNGSDLIAAFGMKSMGQFYMGLLAIELLIKATCAVRPYEIETGTTAAVHSRNLLRIETGIVEGDVPKALDESLRMLSGIAVKGAQERPVVGIAGDIYAKANQNANNDLFRRLEDMGLEVWPSPSYVDYLDLTITSGFMRSMSRLNLSESIANGSILLKRLLDAWRMRYVTGNRIKRINEPGYFESKRFAGPYMPNVENELLYVNIAKIVDFARSGVDGIVNVACFNCMVGNATTAIIEKIRRDYRTTPIISTVYSGNEDPSRRILLDAFASQVKDNFRRKKRAASTSL